MKQTFSFVFSLWVFTSGLHAEATIKRPNIIYILSDDLGWTDTATYGSKYYETPNIDKLALQGLKLTQYHNCQNCQPTRAALMSGQYSPRTGVYTVGGIDRFDWKSRTLRPVDNTVKLPLGKITIAQQLKKAGYATAIFGKWHLGEDADHHPSKRGFDEAIVSMGAHFNFKTDPHTPHPQECYLADFLTDRSEDFIRRHKDGPFFLYLPHFAVHVPLQAREDDKNHFSRKAPVGGHHNPTYAGMIYAVDRSVGRIMALLDELKIADNTVVIFSSDNGGVGGYSRADGLIRDPGHEGQTKSKGGKKAGNGAEGDADGETKDTTDNTPLRSGKGSLYEGGTRDPFIVRWPGVVKPGSTCDAPTIHVDVYQTLLEIASAPRPDQVLDGESMVPLFKNPGASLKRQAIYQHFPGYLGSGPGLWRTTPVGTIQVGDWKLMEYFEDHRLELYNLKDDISEKNNLAEKMPDKAKELLAMMTTWRESIKAPMPTTNNNVIPPGNKKSDKAVFKRGK
ncbi:MAG: sulfatase [Verrucomicrobiota bacterium]